MFCFAEASDADLFRECFSGEQFDPKEGGRGPASVDQVPSEFARFVSGYSQVRNSQRLSRRLTIMCAISLHAARFMKAGH